MADWSLIETTLETWVGNITGLPTYWRKRPAAPTFSNSGYALLSISARKTLGIDEVYTEYDSGEAAGEEYRSWQRGHRTFTFAIQIRTHDQTVDTDAKNYTALLHDSLRLPVNTIEVLSAAGISIARVIADTDIDELIADREMSIAQIDILMNAISEVEDTPVGYVATLKGMIAQDDDENELWTGDMTIG